VPDFTSKFSAYFKTDDLREGGPRTLTIRDVRLVELGRDGAQETKPAIFFDEDDRALTLNRSRYDSAADLFGTKLTEKWIGKKITLAVDPNVKFGGKRVGGIVLAAAS